MRPAGNVCRIRAQMEVHIPHILCVNGLELKVKMCV